MRKGWRGHFKCFNDLPNKVVLKDKRIAECLVMSAHVPTLKHKVEHQHMTQKQLFCFLKQLKKQFGGYMLVFNFVLTTPLSICRVSHLLKRTLFVFSTKCLCSSVVFSCFQPAVMSSMSSTSQDCTVRLNNAVKHCI